MSRLDSQEKNAGDISLRNSYDYGPSLMSTYGFWYDPYSNPWSQLSDYSELKEEMNRLREELKDMLKKSDGMEVNKNEGSYTYTFDMPGLEKGNVKITLKNGILFIEGKNEQKSYSYSMTIPKDFNTENIECEMKNGQLLIMIPHNKIEDEVELEIK